MKLKFIPRTTRQAVLSLQALPSLALPLSALFLLSAPGRSHAQVVTGEIDGAVRDASGAVVRGATVVITNTDQNAVVRTVKTDASGVYTAPLLTIGTYSVKVSAGGFVDTTITQIPVHVGQPTSVPVSLSVSGASETVEVTSGQTAIDLDSAAAGTVIGKEETTQLPLSSRNFLQLLSLQPGISQANTPGGRNERGNISSTGAVNTQTFSVNGNGTAQNGYFLDGADTLKRAGQQPVTYASIDFIQEINLQRASYGAQFGGPGSAVVSVQTKAGSSTYHGVAYGFFRTQATSANDSFNKIGGIPTAMARAADYGYGFGGALYIPFLMKDRSTKTFFYVGQEYLRSAFGVTQTVTNIPTAAQRAGTFVTPVCIAYSQGNCVTMSTQVPTINPIAQEYLTDIINKVPLPNNPLDSQGLIYNAVGINNETQTFIRIDHQFSPNLSVFFRYLDDPYHVVAPQGFQQTSNIPGVATSNITDGSTNWLGHVTYVLHGRHVFEGGYATRANWVTAKAIGTAASVNSPDIKIQLPYVSTLDQVPHLNIFGSNYVVSSPYDERNPVTQIFLNNTNALGRHTIKAGFNIELERGGGNGAGPNAGQFNFTGTPANFQQSFANFLTGNVSSFTQTNIDIAAANHTNFYEAFVEDTYHATSRLTVDLGVRYTYFATPTSAAEPGHAALPVLNFSPQAFNPGAAPTIDSNGLICTATPCAGGQTPNPTYNALNGILQGGVNSPFGSGVTTSPANNFAPRFGFSMDVYGDGKTALRGGYGIYYFATPANQAKFATQQDAPNVVTATVSTVNYIPPSFAAPGNGTSPQPSPLQATQDNGKVPYSESFSLDVQQQLGHGFTLDVGYYGNRGVHQTANEDLNQPTAGQYAQITTIGSLNAGNETILNGIRPYKGYAAITTQINQFISNYNSLQASFRKRTRFGAIVTSNYTWSKSLTNARTPQENDLLRPEYGPSGLSRKHISNTSFVYPIPYLSKQKGLVGKLLGGYQVGGIVFFGSGTFYTAALTGVDPAGLGLLVGPLGAGRPDLVGNPNTGARTRLNYFNKAAFAVIPGGVTRVGNDPVANILGPGYQDWDLSFFRNIRITEKSNFQLRAESFNTFNHTNFNNLSTVYGGTNFGQVTGAGPKRNMQFGGKFTF